MNLVTYKQHDNGNLERVHVLHLTASELSEYEAWRNRNVAEPTTADVLSLEPKVTTPRVKDEPKNEWTPERRAAQGKALRIGRIKAKLDRFGVDTFVAGSMMLSKERMAEFLYAEEVSKGETKQTAALLNIKPQAVYSYRSIARRFELI